MKDRGTRRFHDACDRFGGSSHDTYTVHLSRVRFDASAWAFSSHGAVCDRASDILVAIRLAPPASLVFTRAAYSPRVLALARIDAGRKTEEPPRPPLFAPRERSGFETIWDAFHRQGPFAGFGGRYSPDPATTSPLLAMVPPLNDSLPSL